MKKPKATCVKLLNLSLNCARVNLIKAANINETMNENSPLVELTYLPDGTVERRYANGTVNYDYSVASQLSITTTWTVTTTMRAH
jgi:hypothetical protein